jgi:hypothetical protein
MQSKAEQIQLLLVMAAQNALPGLGEAFQAVHYPHGNAAISAVTTLTKIKMLEVIATRAMGEVMGIGPFDAGRILTEIGRNAVLQMVAAGALKVDTAKLMYKNYAMDEVLEKAAVGPDADAKVYSEAVSTLSEALDKVSLSKNEA